MTLLLKNLQIIDVINLKTYPADIFIKDSKINKIGKNLNYKAKKIINCQNRYLSSGFIDGHIHIESTSLSPRQFANLVIRFGTTAVIADPHEIVNVAGSFGFDWMIKNSKNLNVDIFYMAPSCVPATPFETNGADFSLKGIKKYLKNKRVLGLAEVMNFPAVLSDDKDILAKINAAKKLKKIIDGHAPGLSGKALEKYIKSGITSDHECFTFNEAREKLEKGMWIMIREGSAAKNLSSLFPLLKEKKYLDRLMFVTDDKHADELAKEGHLNWILKKAVTFGADPLLCLKLVTVNPASYFKLKNRGVVKPGYLADLVILDDLKNFSVYLTIKNGKIVYKKNN